MLATEGDPTMTRDWLLTLLALSPYFLAGTILLLALIRGLMQREPARRAAEVTPTPPKGSDEPWR